MKTTLISSLFCHHQRQRVKRGIGFLSRNASFPSHKYVQKSLSQYARIWHETTPDRSQSRRLDVDATRLFGADGRPETVHAQPESLVAHLDGIVGQKTRHGDPEEHQPDGGRAEQLEVHPQHVAVVLAAKVFGD